MPKITNNQNYRLTLAGVELEPGASTNVSDDKLTPAMKAMADGEGITVAGYKPQKQAAPIAPPPAPGQKPANDRASTIRAAIEKLKPEDFTDAGKPKVDAINDNMPEGAEPVTADERDSVTQG